MNVSSSDVTDYFGVSSFDEAAELLDEDTSGMESEEVWRLVRNDWESVVEQNLDPEPPDRLPGYDVVVDEVTYRIRGLSHGVPDSELSLDDSSRRTLEKYIESYSEEGEVYTEELFQDLFEGLRDVENINELHETSTAIKSHPDEMNEAIESVNEYAEIFEGMFAEAFDISPTPQNLRDDFVDARKENPPINIKKSYEKENNRTQYLLDIVRSKNQAEEALSRSPDSSEQPITLVVGMQHVPVIKDYLVDDYDAEVLDNYI